MRFSTNVSALEHRIDPDDQLFFLHIPKTAGVSLNAFVAQHFAANHQFLYLTPHSLPQVPADVFTQAGYFYGHIYYDDIGQ